MNRWCDVYPHGYFGNTRKQVLANLRRMADPVFMDLLEDIDAMVEWKIWLHQHVANPELADSLTQKVLQFDPTILNRDPPPAVLLFILVLTDNLEERYISSRRCPGCQKEDDCWCRDCYPFSEKGFQLWEGSLEKVEDERSVAENRLMTFRENPTDKCLKRQLEVALVQWHQTELGLQNQLESLLQHYSAPA